MEPIQITPTREREFSRKLFRTGVYEVIVERFGVDQYGRQWHSFERRFVPEREDLPPASEAGSEN
jgi:hypothetical protein